MKSPIKNVKVDVYQTNEKGTFLFLPQGAPFSIVPRQVLDTVGLLQFFDTFELASDVVGAKHSEIRADLERLGYSVHRAKFKLTDQK